MPYHDFKDLETYLRKCRRKASTRKYRNTHRDRVRKWKRDYYYRHKDRLRKEAVALLGGKCQLCGCIDFDLLEFAHLNWLQKNNRTWSHAGLGKFFEVKRHPENFLLLCAECHRHPEKYLKELIDLRRKLS